MQIHQLKRLNPNRKMPQVGRGGKRGKTSGRGTKGQKARAGRKLRPEIRDLIKRLPKKRGYHFKSIRRKTATVNLSDLEGQKLLNNQVNPQTLLEAKLISKIDLEKGIKILATGEIKEKYEISGLTVSRSAREKVEKAGGKIA